MGKPSKTPPELLSKVQEMLYNDFRNFKVSGFDPSVKVIGGRNHWRTREAYWRLTDKQFRAQAKGIAEKVCQELKSADYDDDDDDQSELAKKI